MCSCEDERRIAFIESFGDAFEDGVRDVIFTPGVSGMAVWS
jgi:hypothetical protein